MSETCVNNACSKDACKVKFFYFLMALAGLVLILFPVGIANVIFGYIMGDSPCTLCWGQRQAMIFIGVMAFFIVRYGLKGKYLAMLLIMTAFGFYQSFAQFGMHAHRDLDQGFSLQVFGIHTYFWAEVVFFAVVFLLGVFFFFAPKLSAFDKEMNGESVRKWCKFSFSAVLISTIIVASNVVQAFISTGIPPYTGQGDPVRFSLNPKFIIWSTDGWNGKFNGFSVLGKRDVKAPDYAFAPNEAKLGITFSNDSNNAPVAIDEALNVSKEQKIDFAKPLNTLALINNEFVASSKFEVFFFDKDFKLTSDFEIDPYFSATIDPIVGIIPYMQDKYMLIGSNKSLLRFGKNENADESLQWADFVRGYDKFEGQGKGLGRGRLDTVRAKFHHIQSLASDGKYFYTASVPNNKDKKSFVISKFSLSDRVLSGEFTPQMLDNKLKENRSLGELYVTALAYQDGLLYALSKNYNTILVIEPKDEVVIRTLSFPANITNARSLFFDEDKKLNILSYQNGENLLFTLSK
ncbi:disulfide bond formation protein B [Campylobacter sp. MIT 12-5580]|uniref:disulfide bond formation protein DsbI n=1 Tax=Campylobacter sp. MIT 12-5580 TaxID=2040651 RepID=UPI0010F9F48B|nr:disulfide bond formation protein B [Campylobacter sp. MIT 12-5580]TKX29580.1 disulfide bond formation protein B [Campylobacter sp. MIT 12-5580]